MLQIRPETVRLHCLAARLKLSFFEGFLPSNIEWHKSQGFQKTNDHLQKNFSREKQPMGAKLQTNMSLASYGIAEKRALLYSWSHAPGWISKCLSLILS